MRAVIIGAGPVGLFCGVVLARRGCEVSIVDRDPGPAADGSWHRKGVMQFNHPHFFRPNVRFALADEAPDAWEAAVAAGGVPVTPPGAPSFVTALQCRRSTFEAAVRGTAERQPNLVLRCGRAERLVVEGGRAAGVIVDGDRVEADLVIDAGGRAGHFGDDLRPPAEGGPCGFSYVSRHYRARPGVDDLAGTTMPMGQLYDGYLTIVFPQDAGTLSALILRRSDDAELAEVRHRDRFDLATQVIPHLARWTDPDRFEPITDVLPGGGLRNSYRAQALVPGYVSVGDSVCTTNPAAGRGVSLGLEQARALLQLLEEGAEQLAERFQSWCDEHNRPWYEDHVYWDDSLRRRFAGEDLDLTARIPSDVICAAAEVDPEIAPYAQQYLAMTATPGVLDPVEQRARVVLESGWRPKLGDGPNRDELVDLLQVVPVG